MKIDFEIRNNMWGKTENQLQTIETHRKILCPWNHVKSHFDVLDPTRKYSHIFIDAINIGSVGKPKDGDPRGCYAIITLEAHSSKKKKDSISVEFIRFEYDVDTAAKAIENSPLPNEFADMLRRGF
jgi:diadenosine tetraphosphatase ApaH/serine/threonine PP2A family protein phosphatase